VIFDLSGAHEDYRSAIEDILSALYARYPWAPLRRVDMYRPNPDDRSLAYTTAEGVIRLNPYWFAREPSRLREAEMRTVVPVDVGGGVRLPWHFSSESPRRVLTHEFGHVVALALPSSKKWSQEGWRAATDDPCGAVSAYSLFDPLEFFAEAFASIEMGRAPRELALSLRELLENR
jgi:hypothetical protein